MQLNHHNNMVLKSYAVFREGTPPQHPLLNTAMRDGPHPQEGGTRVGGEDRN